MMANRLVLLLSSALEGMNNILSVERREKGSKTKSSIPYPNVVKLCNSSMGGVDLTVWSWSYTAAYGLDQKSSIRFYFRIFFDLVDIAVSIVTSFITWNILTNCLSLITILLSQELNSILSRPRKGSTNVKTI